MEIMEKSWGALPDGRPVHLYTIMNGAGASVTVSDLGGIVTSLLVPDAQGKLRDVVLGYDTAAEYLSDTAFTGAMIGRYANRIGGASVTLHGTRWTLTDNENGNTLHGGSGFHKKLWDAAITGQGLHLQYVSPHCEDGFPGNLQVDLLYSLSDDNAFTIDVTAVSDQDTVCCITNHSYFNLSGSGEIHTHQFQVNADGYTPFLPDLLPSGEIAPVEGAGLDFHTFRVLPSPEFDRNFALRPGHTVCASARDPHSGIQMDVISDLPALQIYDGYAMSPRTGKNGSHYGPYSGVCLEPQFFPDSPHKPQFPSCILPAGEIYHHALQYRFSTVQYLYARRQRWH